MIKKIRKAIPKPVAKLAAPPYRKLRGRYLYSKHDMSGVKIKLLGVTGTNGKTTTTSYLNSILKAAGHKTALTTTVNTEVLGKYVRNTHHLTSGTTEEMFEFIKLAEKKGADYAIMEVTSQALEQQRHWGLKYEGSAITNLSYEHMEYHLTMEAYAKAKAILFKMTTKIAAINHDDDWYKYFSKVGLPSGARRLSYGKHKNSNIHISNLDPNTKGTAFDLRLEDETVRCHTKLVGLLNVYNAVAAASVAHGIGINSKHIKQGIANLDWLDGRVNPIDEGQDFAVFTDYAHTPDGLEKVLLGLKEITKGKLILVQSTMDGRDPNKWPKLGEVSGRIADKIFVCDEEAFELPTEVMRNAIIKGIKKVKAQDKLTEIEDRKEAIEAAVASANKDDTVLVVPFGHITEMTFYDKTINWDERKVVANAIRKLQGKKPYKIPTKVQMSKKVSR